MGDHWVQHVSTQQPSSAIGHFVVADSCSEAFRFKSVYILANPEIERICFLLSFPFACPLCCCDRLIALRKVQFEINISRISNFSKGEKHLPDIFEDWEPCWSRDVTKVRAWPWISRHTLQNKTIKVASWPPSYLTECCSQKGKQITRMQIMPLVLFAQLSSFVEEGRFTNLVTNSMGHFLANRCNCIKWVFLQMHFVFGVIQGQRLYRSPNLYLRSNSMHFSFQNVA